MRWWFLREIEQDKQRKLKCRIGLHVYKWSWWHLRHECTYCGKKKGGANNNLGAYKQDKKTTK